jgi:hypothetical protein
MTRRLPLAAAFLCATQFLFYCGGLLVVVGEVVVLGVVVVVLGVVLVVPDVPMVVEEPVGVVVVEVELGEVVLLPGEIVVVPVVLLEPVGGTPVVEGVMPDGQGLADAVVVVVEVMLDGVLDAVELLEPGPTWLLPVPTWLLLEPT